MTATIAVHEFISADGVFESPTWTPSSGSTRRWVRPSPPSPERVRHHPARPPYPRDVRARLARPHGRGRPGRDFFNQTEKFVVGANEPAEEWANTTRLGAYDADAIRRLKEERDGVIYVSGSGQLVRGLIRDGLVDDVHLFVYPISLGEGDRFWAEGEQNKLALKAHDVYDNGVVHLELRPGLRVSTTRPAGPRWAHGGPLRRRARRTPLRARTTSSRCSPTTTASTGSTYPRGTTRPSRCSAAWDATRWSSRAVGSATTCRPCMPMRTTSSSRPSRRTSAAPATCTCSSSTRSSATTSSSRSTARSTPTWTSRWPWSRPPRCSVAWRAGGSTRRHRPSCRTPSPRRSRAVNAPRSARCR